MRRALWLGGATLLLASATWATREPTVPPTYYLLDYGYNHLDNPQYVEWVKQLPPELLHFGKDVPMTHVFGPIAAVGGENQAHGRNRADIRRLSPAELKTRMAGLQKLTADLHAAGVTMVMPYISALTYAGDPQKRDGLFEFYDHWDEYAEFGIGPKPKTDPVQWAAVKADGSYCTFGNELAPAYYSGMNRYVACIEHPDWRTWLQQVTKLVAQVGYDGAFPDNSSAYQCYAPCCQEAFGKYLAAKFGGGTLQELFGTRDPSAIRLPVERTGLLWVEAQRFWQTSLGNHLEQLRAAGRQVNPKFLMFPNCGSPLQSAEYLAGKVDYIMLEGSGAEKEGAGYYRTPIIGDIGRREVVDNILQYRYVADVPGDVRLLLLALGKTPESQQLCLAEAAAFGSGAYNGARPNTRTAMQPMIAFLKQHRDLYEGKTSSAAVALLYFPMRSVYPRNNHAGSVIRLAHRLEEVQVPYDCFSENGLNLAQLKTYPVCFAADLSYLSQKHREILREYVKEGGRLVITGEFATFDELCRPWPAPEWVPAPGQETRLEKGTVVSLPVAPTRTDLLKLLEPTGNWRLVDDDHGRRTYPLLRGTVYAGPKDRVLHLLNYGCPLGPGQGKLTPVRDVLARVPLPFGDEVLSVVCYQPGEAPTKLPYKVHGGACQFTVPEVASYAVCDLEVKAASVRKVGEGGRIE